jgi:hypothetical protein
MKGCALRRVASQQIDDPQGDEARASVAACVVSTHDKGFFAVEGALTISSNSMKRWWPGTELNRRRQPFQCYVMLCFKQLK